MKKYLVLIVLFCVFMPVMTLAKNKIVISVLYFQNTIKSKDVDWLSKGLADMLISDLSASDDLTLVERENLQKVIDEQHFAQSGFADNNQAIKLGKVLNAEKIVTGSYIVSGNDLRIDIKIIDTSTAEIKSATASGYLKDLISIEKRMLIAAFKMLDVTYPENVTIDTNSYFAVQNFYQGVDLLDQGLIQQALEKFEKSEQFDPLYNKPQLEKEKAFTFLKNFKKARYYRELSVLFKEANEIIKRMEQKPFLQYMDVYNNSNWGNMTELERTEFNKKYQYHLLYTSPMHCAMGLQQKFMEIISKREEMLDDEWDTEEEKLDAIKSDIDAKKHDESRIISDKRSKLDEKYHEDREKIMEIQDYDERDVKLKPIDEKYKADKKTINDELGKLNEYYEKKADAAEKAIDDFDIRREQAEADLDKKNRILYDKIISIADNAEKSPVNDQFYESVLYYRLLSLRLVKDYDKLRIYCESFMKNFPEARMMWAVEDMYEEALKKSE